MRLHVRVVVAFVLVVLAGTGLRAQPFVYATDIDSDVVYVVDAFTQSLVDTIALPPGAMPLHVVFSADATRAYVSHYGTTGVSVIDTSTRTVIGTFSTGTTPLGMALTPDGAKLYVVQDVPGRVRVIDTATGATVKSVIVKSTADGIFITPDGSRVYVTDNDPALDGNVTAIETDTDTVIASIAVGTNPIGIAGTPDGTRAYVTNTDSNTVDVIDTDPGSGSYNLVIATVPVSGLNPIAVAVTPDGTRAYVTLNNSGAVDVIDTDPGSGTFHTVLATIPIGAAPRGIAITPDGRKAFVGADGLDVIDTDPASGQFNSRTRTIWVDPFWTAVTPDPAPPECTARPSENADALFIDVLDDRFGDTGIESVTLDVGAVNLEFDPPVPVFGSGDSALTVKVLPTTPGVNAQGTVLITDRSLKTCSVPVSLFQVPAGPITTETQVCGSDTTLLEVNNTDGGAGGTAVCGVQLPEAPVVIDYPAGFEPSQISGPEACRVLSVKSSINGITDMIYTKATPLYEPRLRLLFSECLGTPTQCEAGVGFTPFADVTSSSEPGSVMLRGQGCWSAVRMACAVRAEVCNGRDDDGDGLIDEGLATNDTLLDGDLDGVPQCPAAGTPDCNDANPAIFPGATEVLNGIDDDCDFLVDEGLIAPAPGRVPNGADAPGIPLILDKAGPIDLALSWGTSCQATDVDYAIYAGPIPRYTGHRIHSCTTGGLTSAVITPTTGSRYYLVVPNNGTEEGSYGFDSDGTPRSAGFTACLAQGAGSCP